MLSNAYFLAKFRFDTAEKEPAKTLQNFAKKKFANFEFSQFSQCASGDMVREPDQVRSGSQSGGGAGGKAKGNLGEVGGWRERLQPPLGLLFPDQSFHSFAFTFSDFSCVE